MPFRRNVPHAVFAPRKGVIVPDPERSHREVIHEEAVPLPKPQQEPNLDPKPIMETRAG